MIQPSACSQLSRAVGEPMGGSAPFARGWIAIEQLGPYGPKALTESHLPPEIGERLEQLTSEHDIRPELIRAVGRHADLHESHPPRTVLLACSVPGRVAMSTLTIEHPAVLLSIDFAALAAGAMADVHPHAEPVNDPVLLVCTHAKRDVCCATLGRPLAEALARDPRTAGEVWECSHLGGHRFAPTAVQLPHGWVHGRLDAASAQRVLTDARDGQVPLETARGRSSLQLAEQIADIEFRKLESVLGIDETRVQDLGSDVVEVSAPNRKPRSVTLKTQVYDEDRPESCGKGVTQVTGFTLSWL